MPPANDAAQLRRPVHHRRVGNGPLAGRWVPLVMIEPGGACAQQAIAREQEAAALVANGALLVQGPVPAVWFHEFWPDLMQGGEVSFEYMEAYSSESLRAA